MYGTGGKIFLIERKCNKKTLNLYKKYGKSKKGRK